MMRSRLGAAGAAIYLLLFTCAAAYPLFDHGTFAGMVAVLMGLPWIDYIPGSLFLGAIALNAILIYLALTAIASLVSFLLRLHS
jgi:hypothetical protein